MGYDGKHRKERKQHSRKATAYGAAALAVAVPYIGNGYMIQASTTGTPIEKSAIAGYYLSNLLGVVRP